MKRIFTLLIFAAVIACSDTVQQLQPENNLIFNKDVGEQIPIETAQRWINRIQRGNGNNRIESFSISRSSLENTLNSVSDKHGVVFHHATDDQGVHHVLVIPIKEDLKLWSAGVVLDANVEELVDAQIAKSWCERFKADNPTEIRSHFFGIHIFDQSLSENDFSVAQIIPGINDSDLPQLLIYLTDEENNEAGRLKSSETALDASILCPNHCLEEIF